MDAERDHKVAFFVDDDRDFVEMIPHMVKHPHFEVRSYCAANGYRAIDEVIKARPDVLFIDFGLPRASGAQLLPVLKSVQNLSGLRVYLVTGYAKDQIFPFVQSLDLDGILFKGGNLSSEILNILNAIDNSSS